MFFLVLVLAMCIFNLKYLNNYKRALPDFKYILIKNKSFTTYIYQDQDNK